MLFGVCTGVRERKMRAVIQRVKRAVLCVDGKTVSEIPWGLVVFLGVGRGDTREQADKTVARIAALRVFSDGDGKMNLSVRDVGGQVLFVSQFTLYGDVSRGNRPSFTQAEEPLRAKELYDYAAEQLKKQGVTVKKGVFGADMQIEQHNDGPVTILTEY